MKSKQSFTFFVILCGFWAYIPSAQSEPERTIQLAIDPWYPWIIGEENAHPKGGIGVELIQELFKRLKIKPEISLYPFKRVLQNLKTGKVDGSWLITKNAQRERLANFSDILLTDSYQIYTNKKIKNDFEWHHWKDLHDYSIGLVDGFDYGLNFRLAEQTFGYNTYTATNDFQLIRMLLLDRVDLIILNRTVAQAMQAQHYAFRNKLHQADTPINQTDFYVLISKKSSFTFLMPEVNRTIRSMKKDGSIDRILNQYSPETFSYLKQKTTDIPGDNLSPK